MAEQETITGDNVNAEDVPALVKKMTANQADVLLEALDFASKRQSAGGVIEMQWYHRGKHGFGISRRTALSLKEKGLAQEAIWEQWHRDTQFVKLTPLGQSVAQALLTKNRAFKGR
jgi:hypothetical protein